jgi:hypothetical protein
MQSRRWKNSAPVIPVLPRMSICCAACWKVEAGLREAGVTI